MERNFIEEEIQQTLSLSWDTGKVTDEDEKQFCQWVKYLIL